MYFKHASWIVLAAMAGAVWCHPGIGVAQVSNQQWQHAVGQNRGMPANRSATPYMSARSSAAGGSLVGLRTALAGFYADVGRMPTTTEGLGALLRPPPGVRNWRGPYISSNNWRAELSDPWGNPYRYYTVGAGRSAAHYISSNGRDGKPGTRDDITVQF